ncbi:MAG: type II toxin-antitoxin system RatA family toxin [Ahniella sp.]|nr:type II toxin-antitoxin system RatA family toxin [Ahniella sp.]
MSRIERTALIAQPALRVFDLVNEVEGYPGLFSWCKAASIGHREEGRMRAKLDLSYLGFRAAFSTENTFVTGEMIQLNLVEGPFRSLRGEWRFLPLGEAGCKTSLMLDFEFAGSLMGSALALGFQSLADRLVDDFSRAARALPKAA